MNSLLPDDIRILQCSPCSVEFNSNKDSKSKEYHYYFCTDTIHNPVFNDTVAHVPIESNEIVLMQEACKLFVGEHDFYNFSKRDTTMNSTLRTIRSCEILQVDPFPFGNKIYYLKIIGTGFLRYMVRYIAGALFALGKQELCILDISEALKNHKNEKISAKSKSHGLHLIKICY